MSLLSTDIAKIKRLSLKEVKLPAPKERELKPLEPILKDKVIENAVVIKPSPEPILKGIEIKVEPNIKSLWDSLDSSSKSFWIAGGRGGEVGFTTFENNKKY
jgi:hypothetical protein